MQTAHRLSLVLAAAACVALSAGAANASERWPAGHRSGSAHADLTRTAPDGTTRTWQRDSTWQRANGRFDRHEKVTGANGGTASKDVHAARTASGFMRDTTFTDAHGRTATRQAEVVNDPAAATHTKTVDWTGRDGQTASRVAQVQRTATGRDSTTTVTRPDVSVVQYDKSVTHGAPAANPPASE